MCINIGRKCLPNVSVSRIHYLFVKSYNQNIKILARINSDKNLKRKRGGHPQPVPVAVQHVFMCLKARFQHKSSEHYNGWHRWTLAVLSWPINSKLLYFVNTNKSGGYNVIMQVFMNLFVDVSHRVWYNLITFIRNLITLVFKLCAVQRNRFSNIMRCITPIEPEHMSNIPNPVTFNNLLKAH